MIKIQMPEDNRLHSPKKAIYLIESILKIEVKLKNPSLPDNTKEALRDNLSLLLNKATIELMKPGNPRLMPEEERKYIREPFVSYFIELAIEWQKIANFQTRKTRKAKKKRKKDTFELPSETDEEIKQLFRLLKKDSFKHFKHMQYLAHLQFGDKDIDIDKAFNFGVQWV